jgi:hypothetical protein
MRVLSAPHTLVYAAFGSLFFFGLFSCAPNALASSIMLSPSSGTHAAGDTFTVTVTADPQGEAVYAVDAQLEFDTNKLAVMDISKTTAFSLWTEQPSFSNAAGTITFGGGSPDPLQGPTDIVTLTFRALAQEGEASVSVVNASMRSLDETGSAGSYSGSTDAHYMIAAASNEVAMIPLDESQPEASRIPQATSDIFSDPNAWYSTTEGLFTWDVPSGVTRIAFDIATSSDAEPNTPYEPDVEQFHITPDLLAEGVQYFALQYKYPDGWGPTLHRAIRIDTKPPEPFTVSIYTGNASGTFPLLAFDTHDETSGIAHYTLSVGDAEPVVLTEEEVHAGYVLRDLADGTYMVRIVAEDQAGNTQEAMVPVSITAGWHPSTDADSSHVLGAEGIMLLILLLGILGQWFSMLRLRRMHRAKEERVRAEMKEIQEQMEKIFSALRGEIYDQINSITKRKRLSIREKEAVASLNQALEISESLIEKEIIDVNKLLK